MCKRKVYLAINKQVHTYITRNSDCHRYVHNLELYTSKPTTVSCIFCKPTTELYIL
jgi:hypothetical protein